MVKLVELNAQEHKDLRVKPNAAIDLAKQQHAISLRVTEVSQAGTSFPVFVTKVENSTEFAMSAITSFDVGKNYFVKDNLWTGLYVPQVMRTYPLYLVRSEADEKKPVVGIDSESDAFSMEEGEILFDSNGKPSIYHTRMQKVLNEDMKNGFLTFQFLKYLNENKLLKAMDINIQYTDNKINTLKGLYTVDEEKLQDLSSEKFEELRKLGYLGPMYAMLFSIFQVNSLIKMHNANTEGPGIVNLKMEVTKHT